MYQLIAVVCSVNVFDNSDFFQFRACQHGNALWCVLYTVHCKKLDYNKGCLLMILDNTKITLILKDICTVCLGGHVATAVPCQPDTPNTL